MTNGRLIKPIINDRSLQDKTQNSAFMGLEMTPAPFFLDKQRVSRETVENSPVYREVTRLQSTKAGGYELYLLNYNDIGCHEKEITMEKSLSSSPTNVPDELDEIHYEHTCEKCIFVGNDFNTKTRGFDVDLYFCGGKDPEFMTFIARMSSEPSDFIAGPPVGDGHLKVAARNAVSMGLLNKEETTTLLKALLR